MPVMIWREMMRTPGKSKFLRDGYQAECVMKGLGEYASIRRIYVEHAGCAVGALG